MLSQSLLAREFPQDEALIYLNHAAVSPWPKRSSDAARQFAEENCVTGAENYAQWMKKEQLLREQLRKLLNAPSVDDIAILKNTSEALSVVACGIDWKAGDNVVTTDEEFPSNRFPWEAQAQYGVTLKQVVVQSADPEAALIAACDKHTRVMTISSVQYGSGLRLDLEKLGRHCRENNILFCIDAIQSIGAHKFDVQAVHADFAMADAHKWMLGPEGIALFYCRAEIRNTLKLHQFGWHMVQHAGDYDRKDWQAADSAKRFECGSPNMLGTHVLSASLSLIEEIGIENIETAISNKIGSLVEKLIAIDGLQILGPTAPRRRAGIVTFKLKDTDHRALYRKLMRQRLICANRYGGIRFSPHFYTPASTINKAVEILMSTV